MSKIWRSSERKKKTCQTPLGGGGKMNWILVTITYMRTGFTVRGGMQNILNSHATFFSPWQNRSKAGDLAFGSFFICCNRLSSIKLRIIQYLSSFAQPQKLGLWEEHEVRKRVTSMSVTLFLLLIRFSFGRELSLIAPPPFFFKKNYSPTATYVCTYLCYACFSVVWNKS